MDQIGSISNMGDDVNSFLMTTRPAVHWVPRALSVAGHLTPSSAESKTARIYFSTQPYAFRACCLGKRETLILYFFHESNVGILIQNAPETAASHIPPKHSAIIDTI
jgi:hypothetical protein